MTGTPDRPLDCCVFAVRLAAERERPVAEQRVRALERFYSPLGTPAVTTEYEPSTGVLAGAIRFDGRHERGARSFTFGGRLPPDLDLIAASDADLRSLEGPFAGIALEPGRCRIVGGTGPTALYHGAGNSAEAWSSHAIAASFLATGDARVNLGAVPSLMAMEFAGGDESVIAGSTALPAASCVEIDRGGPKTRSYWPLAERWAPLREDEAYSQASAALVVAARRLDGEDGVVCALTAGLDSRVVALALREAEVDFTAITWGDPDWPDVLGAASVATELGVEHRAQPAEWFEEEHAVAEGIAAARWSEGGRIDFGRPVFPRSFSALVTGAGGETGRCFYYRPATVLHARPSSRTLVRQLIAGPGSRLEGSSPEARSAFAASAQRWVEEAEALGARGWRALDVVYGEQRLRRWGRHMLMRSGAPLAVPLASPRVQQALTWLPLADRATDGFHRRFVAERAGALEVPPPPPLSRRRVPPALRRAVRAARGGGARARSPAASMWEWSRHRKLHEWIAEVALTSPLLADALGEPWLNDLRRRFLTGERDAEELARWAAGPVALEEALSELRGSGTGAGGSRQDDGP